MSKKVAILTFPGSPSFGASLQMTALYHVLKEGGHEVDILNYMNSYMKEKKHISSSRRTLKRRLTDLLSRSSTKKFRTFEKKLTFAPSKITHDKQQLSVLEKKYDKIVCGSDQVWNPHITGSDLSYFLDFCPPKKRVSYAPSFGITELPAVFEKAVAPLLSSFAALSVREAQGNIPIQKMLNRDATVVLDPTMLISADFWAKQEKKPRKKLPDHYIASFIFHPNAETADFTSQLSRETGYPVLRYSFGIRDTLRKDCATGYGPAEWLYYIRHADYVITDSFHGSVFSMLFHRKLFVSPHANANSRLLNLLAEFEMEDRLIRPAQDNISFTAEPDFDRFEQIKQKRADDSRAFLYSAIESES